MHIMSSGLITYTYSIIVKTVELYDIESRGVDLEKEKNINLDISVHNIKSHVKPTNYCQL